MILSFVILCCDKDYQMIAALLDNIRDVWNKQHVSFDTYEVIIIDNRENEKNTAVNWHTHVEHLLVHKSGKNIRQFMSRNIGVQLASGDYVWFVDADDSILEIPTLSAFSDMHFYKVPVMYDGYGVFITAYSNMLLKSYIEITDSNRQDFADLLLSDAAIVLWDRIIKRDLLLKCYNSISVDDLHDISASEDFMLSVLLINNCADLSFTSEQCYRYNIDISSMGAKVVDNDTFDRMVYGYHKVIEYLYSMQDLSINIQHILKSSILSMLYNVCIRLPVCKDKQHVINWLLKYWRMHTIYETLNNLNTLDYDNQSIIECIVMLMNSECTTEHFTLEEIYETICTDTVL